MAIFVFFITVIKNPKFESKNDFSILIAISKLKFLQNIVTLLFDSWRSSIFAKYTKLLQQYLFLFLKLFIRFLMVAFSTTKPL